MVFLGLDPSTKCTGYCLMDINYDIIEKGKIVSPENVSESEKIGFQTAAIEVLMGKYDIKRILCEDQFQKVNIDTLKKLSRTTGAFMSSGIRFGYVTDLIYPASWRKIFHGSGKASKKDTFDKVKVIYGLDDLVFSKDNDMTDAIGIAWACVDLYKEGVAA